MTEPAGPRASRPRIVPVDPPEVKIEGAQGIPLTIHQDQRGFLFETFRSDDPRWKELPFRMSYSSFTAPNQFRDVDRWHVHQVQVDRFVVVLGSMTLVLYDPRKDSPTAGTLQAVRLAGIPLGSPTYGGTRTLTTYLQPIPPGVLHALGNLSDEPFVYQNFPSELYNPADEGRVPFADLAIPAIGGPFSWPRVRRLTPHL